MRQVGLLGGSFNPPHICHLLASLYLLQTTELEEVWWLPVHRHAFAKDRDLLPFTERVALCEAVVEGLDAIVVDPIERELGGRSYAIDTLAALRQRHPTVEFSWIIGSDILPELPLWSRWEELRDQLSFVVLGRGAAVDPGALPPGGRFQIRDFQLPDISSSEVRRLLRAGLEVEHLLPRAVTAYLRAHPSLYR
ncbi:MAG: nicotinate (nicotinamide) nucleotide adenylyltransferase [Rickettsiales bacterium]|nr:nicotinate (nicotinamide) nucleotide adenylyltransferase [Rickettsiales bacterium]